MKPYYDEGHVTIYHGDCREVLPTLTDPVVIATDQPYGTGWARGGGGVGEFKAKHEQPEWDRWDTSWSTYAKRVLGWCVFGPFSRAAELRSAFPAPNQLVWWRKTNPRPNGPCRDPILVAPAHIPGGIEFAAYNGDTPYHPCEKPLALMLWALEFTPHATTVDPFMGSGTTLVAARQLGRRAIGIEIEERYCEIAAKRLAQGSLPLFVDSTGGND